MASSLALLPQELIDTIIDGIAWRDSSSSCTYRAYELKLDIRKNLASCALVCRAFRAQCQMHLFTTIRLERYWIPPAGFRDDRRRSRKRLYEALKEGNGRLAGHVKELRLGFCANNDEENWWISMDASFVRMLKLLASLRSKLGDGGIRVLVIEGGYLKSLSFHDPTNIFPRFVSPTLTAIHISFIRDLPIEVLIHCPNLTDLRLDYVSLHVRSPTSSKPSGFASIFRVRRQKLKPLPQSCHSRPRIEYLEHKWSSSAVLALVAMQHQSQLAWQSVPPQLQSYFDLSALKKFVFDIGEEDAVRSAHILLRDAPALEELRLCATQESKLVSLAGYFDLHASHRLRILQITVLIRGRSDGITPSSDLLLADLIDILGTIPQHNSIQQLHLIFRVGFHGEVYLQHLLDAQWVRLRSLINQINGWSGKRLELDLHVVRFTGMKHYPYWEPGIKERERKYGDDMVDGILKAMHLTSMEDLKVIDGIEIRTKSWEEYMLIE